LQCPSVSYSILTVKKIQTIMRQVFLHRMPEMPKIGMTIASRPRKMRPPCMEMKQHIRMARAKTISIADMMSATLRADENAMMYGRWVVRMGRGEKKPASVE
ncbi:hypothetical protein PENTCL1PPCAC_874, partial [Pristionchus entomophagus]